jgi:hypothetical protein
MNIDINTNDRYATRDLAEAALLLTKNQKLLRLERQGKIVYFIFSGKEKCEELSNQFWFGECLANAKSYYEAMATLKNRIFAKEII